MKLSRLREHFGTAGLVVAIVALVAALGGGAYAATGGSGGGKATASAKGKPGPRGKTGKTGPAGPAGSAGPAGPSGPQGPAGAKGDTGAAGSNGAPGAPGASVTNTAIPPSSATCNHLGGAEFKVGAGAPTTACNGATGYTKELPSEATETGTWWIIGNSEKRSEYFPISFPIPLSEAAAEAITVHFWREAVEPHDPSGACLGTPAAPEAEPGAICFYLPTAAGSVKPEVFKPDFSNFIEGEFIGEGVSTSGALLHVTELAPNSHGGGTFAVTAP